MTPPRSGTPRLAAPAGAGQAAREGRKPLDSASLLSGDRCVEIRHNGEVYRLQVTGLGKLILTK